MDQRIQVKQEVDEIQNNVDQILQNIRTQCVEETTNQSTTTTPTRRFRNELTLKQKHDLVIEFENNPNITQRQLSEKYDIGRTTVSDILKRKNEYKFNFENIVNPDRKRTVRNTRFSEVNDIVYEWFKDAFKNDVRLKGSAIQEKAINVAFELGLYDFRASNGWLDSWRSRYDPHSVQCFHKVCTVSVDGDKYVVNKIQNQNPPLSKKCKKARVLKRQYDLIVNSGEKPKLVQMESSDYFETGETVVSENLKTREEYKMCREMNSGTKRKRPHDGSQICVEDVTGEAMVDKFENETPPSHKRSRKDSSLEKDPSLSVKNCIENIAINQTVVSDILERKEECKASERVPWNSRIQFDFRSAVNILVQDYAPQDVFHAKETGLFFKSLPDNTLALKGHSFQYGEFAKERMTILLACSSNGEKFKPLVIGNDENPGCFTNIERDNLPVFWRSNHKSWMTQLLFTEWIRNINQQMVLENRKIIIFLDHTISHFVNLKLSNVTLQLLPQNKTSHAQPLDLGIIREFKVRYRKLMLKHLLAKIDVCKTNCSLAKSINILDSIYWIAKSWNETQENTIIKCFRDTGYPILLPSETGIDLDHTNSDDEITLACLWNRVEGSDTNFDQMFEIESTLPIEEPSNEKSERSLLYQIKVEDDSETEESIGTGSDFTHEDMLLNINQMLKFSIAKDGRYIDALVKMKIMTEETIICKKFAAE